VLTPPVNANPAATTTSAGEIRGGDSGRLQLPVAATAPPPHVRRSGSCGVGASPGAAANRDRHQRGGRPQP